MLNEGNQIQSFISSSGTRTVINYGSGSDFLTSYGSGSISKKITVPVPQHCKKERKIAACLSGCLYLQRSPRSHTLRRKSRQVCPSSARRSPSYAGNAIAAAAAARKYERGGGGDRAASMHDKYLFTYHSSIRTSWKHLTQHAKYTLYLLPVIYSSCFNKQNVLATTSVADPDPVPFWPLDSEWLKNRIRIRDDRSGSYFRELRNQFLGYNT